jgi:hypothetical protein
MDILRSILQQRKLQFLLPEQAQRVLRSKFKATTSIPKGIWVVIRPDWLTLKRTICYKNARVFQRRCSLCEGDHPQ